MKKLISITLALLGLTAGAQTFVNTNTGQYAATLPNQIAVPGGTLSNPTSNELVQLGWLTISNTIAPVSGWVTTSNAVIPYVPINGWCYLLPAASNNIQATFNASVTNNPNWAQIVADCLTYRATLRWYVGSGQETNAVVNNLTTWLYMQTNTAFLTSFTNFQNMTYCLQTANNEILPLGFTDTASFWKWWNLYIGL